MREFMMSYMPFKDNDKNPLLGEIRPVLRLQSRLISVPAATGIDYFFEAFAKEPH